MCKSRTFYSLEKIEIFIRMLRNFKRKIKFVQEVFGEGKAQDGYQV